MKNFGPYKGEINVEFRSKKRRNLWIIYGKNGSGKTHILKALLWCLYGCDPSSTRKKQYGAERDAWRVIYGAHLEDQPLPEPYMHVNLFLETDSEDPKKPTQYVVKRSVSPRTQNPRNPTQIKCDFVVIKDGRTSDSPREEVETILPLAASQFFMFHGEQIREMSQKHAEETHKAIELILEAETFRQGKYDLSYVARTIDNDLDDERRKSGGMDDLLDLKKRIKERIQSLEIESMECKNEITDKKSRLESVEADLARNEESKVLKEKHDQLSVRLKANEDERKRILQRRGDLINELPSKMILPELQKILRGKEERHKRREKQNRSILELKGRLKLTRGVMKLDKCRLCGRRITDDEKKHIEEEGGNYEKEIARLEADLEEEDPTYYEIKQTIAVIASSRMNFAQFKKDLSENALSHDEIENNIRDIKKRLTESKIEEVKTLMEERNQLLTDMGGAKTRLDNYTDDLEGQRKRLEKALSMIEGREKHSNIKANLEKQLDLAERCVGAFENVLNRLSDVRRRAIGDYATEVFRALTNKPEEYDRIEIDEQFNVSVIDRHNHIVYRADLSTGERLIVALSFILGLKQASEKVAPLVLDTFFAHLDVEHFENIVKTLPKFADQVILILTNLEYRNLKEMAPNRFFEHIAQTLHTVRNKEESRSYIAPGKEVNK